MEDKTDERLTPKEAAHILTLPYSIMNGLVRSGKIKLHGFGSNAYFLKSEIQAIRKSSNK